LNSDISLGINLGGNGGCKFAYRSKLTLNIHIKGAINATEKANRNITATKLKVLFFFSLFVPFIISFLMSEYL